MLGGIRNTQEPEVLPLYGTVFCLDCEAVSNSRSNECPACRSHSLLSLARILGGSLHERNLDEKVESGKFDVVLTIELQQMKADDLNITLEGLTKVIGPRLARGRASFHIDVLTTPDNSSDRAA